MWMSTVFAGLLPTSPGFAQSITSVGTTLNYQLASNGRTYETRQPISFRAGYRFQWADVFGEYSYVKSATGTDLVSIGLQSHEFLVWIRKFDPTAYTFKPYVALGAGAHYDVVSTRFAQDTSRDPGEFEVLAAAVGGLQIRLSRNVEFSFEGRASAAPSYRPNPILGVSSYFNLLL